MWCVSYSAMSASVSISAMLIISCIMVLECFSMWAAKNQNHLLVVFIFVKADPTGCARVPAENAVFVGNAHRHAWRIREYTIRKILKNRPREIFLILFIAYRGAMLGLPKLQPILAVGFLFVFQYFQQCVNQLPKIATVSPIYELFINYFIF